MRAYAVDVELLEEGVVRITLPPPASDHGWTVQWVATAYGPWQTLADGLGGGSHVIRHARGISLRVGRWRAIDGDPPTYGARTASPFRPIHACRAWYARQPEDLRHLIEKVWEVVTFVLVILVILVWGILSAWAQ